VSKTIWFEHIIESDIMLFYITFNCITLYNLLHLNQLSG